MELQAGVASNIIGKSIVVVLACLFLCGQCDSVSPRVSETSFKTKNVTTSTADSNNIGSSSTFPTNSIYQTFTATSFSVNVKSSPISTGVLSTKNSSPSKPSTFTVDSTQSISSTYFKPSPSVANTSSHDFSSHSSTPTPNTNISTSSTHSAPPSPATQPIPPSPNATNAQYTNSFSTEHTFSSLSSSLSVRSLSSSSESTGNASTSKSNLGSSTSLPSSSSLFFSKPTNVPTANNNFPNSTYRSRPISNSTAHTTLLPSPSKTTNVFTSNTNLFMSPSLSPSSSALTSSSNVNASRPNTTLSLSPSVSPSSSALTSSNTDNLSTFNTITTSTNHTYITSHSLSTATPHQFPSSNTTSIFDAHTTVLPKASHFTVSPSSPNMHLGPIKTTNTSIAPTHLSPTTTHYLTPKSHLSTMNVTSSFKSSMFPSTSSPQEHNASTTYDTSTNTTMTTKLSCPTMISTSPSHSDIQKSSSPASNQSPTPLVVPEVKEFTGELTLSQRRKRTRRNTGLRTISNDVENILDTIYREAFPEEYVYSRVLEILRTEPHVRVFRCSFKVFMRKISNKTSKDLKDAINNYNNTRGFGQFTLHSVGKIEKTKEKEDDSSMFQYWPVIVIAVLGALCCFFVIISINQRRRIRNLKKEKETAIRVGQRVDHFPVFDGLDESQNVPLKLTAIRPKMSTSDPRNPLTIVDRESLSDGDAETTVTEEDDEVVNKNANHSPSRSQNTMKTPDHEAPNNNEGDSLQICESEDEEATKYSTFSRKK